MNSILITGCNRGLGLGLVKSLLKLEQAPRNIFATCRDLAKADVSIVLTISDRCHFECNSNEPSNKNLRAILTRLDCDDGEIRLNGFGKQIPVYILPISHLHSSRTHIKDGNFICFVTQD